MIDAIVTAVIIGGFVVEVFLCWCLCKASARNCREMEELDEQRRL